MKFDLSRLEELVDMMEEHDLVELELEDGETQTAIERLPAAPSASAAPSIDSSAVTITSARVGIFTCKVAVGDRVAEGDLVGEVRVMDVKYAVTSANAGVVTEIFVEDGIGVEYGQPLMRLELDEV